MEASQADVEYPHVTGALPGPRSAQLLGQLDSVLNAGITSYREHPIVQTGYRNCLIVDADGNTFADHLTGWGAAPWGNDPSVQEAMARAQQDYGLQISAYLQTPPVVELAERLARIVPVEDAAVEMSVTGTMAVESAVRIMRAATGRPLILAFGGTFHGNSTILTAALSSDSPGASSGATQYAPGIVTVPYPQTFRSPFRAAAGPHDDCEVLDYLEGWVLRQQHEPDQIAGVLIEPVLTEGGVHVPSDQFWRRLEGLCAEHGWLLCLDEVQTGIGRTGPLFAAELFGLRPDMVLLGKALSAGGAPISAIVAERGLLKTADLNQGSTFGWTPAACAGAIAGLDLFDQHLGAATALGEVALDVLGPAVGRNCHIGDVRAQGALVGIEFVTDQDTAGYAPGFCDQVHQRLLQRGVVAIAEHGKWYLRLQPPYVMAPELMRWSCEQIVEAADEVAREVPEGHDA
jgi:4-aminobutyrate aminotransferase/4-aminobutyrate aminotransferase/(S)-3-amino-2-methylpropionate transaminase